MEALGIKHTMAGDDDPKASVPLCSWYVKLLGS